MKKILISLLSAGMALMSYADNINQNIQLTNDQQSVQITLPANATTGYQWYVQNYDHNLLGLQSYHYAAPNTGLVGAGGKAIFVLTIDPRFYDAPQTSTVTFIYQQAWNPGQNTSTASITLSAAASSNNTLSSVPNPNPNTAPNPNPNGNSSSADNWLSLPSAINS